MSIAAVLLKVRSHFSVQHIQSAALFARQSAKIEKSFDGKFPTPLFTEHRGYVIGSILAAASFLEATINELFADAVDHPDRVKQLNPETITVMADLWRLGVPRTARFSILEKFQIALALAKKPAFREDRLPYQDVKLLIELRNALVHYEPEWVTLDVTPGHKFEKKLKGKFPLNPMTAAGNPFYPDKCLSHGCTKWAVTACVQFVDAFFSKLVLTPYFDQARNELKTE